MSLSQISLILGMKLTNQIQHHVYVCTYLIYIRINIYTLYIRIQMHFIIIAA